MTSPLDIAIELSDLFETTGTEGSEVARLIDSEIIPLLKFPLSETNGATLGDRFAKVLDRVRSSLKQKGGETFRTLMDMMKSAMLTYVQKTHDTNTGRAVYNGALHKGSDTMLTVTAAAILANAMSGSHPDQAQSLMKGIAGQIAGPRKMSENASGAATGAGAIATATTPLGKKKQAIRRRESIFAENSLSWNDLQGLPYTTYLLEAISYSGKSRMIDSVMIDPTTAELILSVRSAMKPDKQRVYESKSIDEMIAIAHCAVKRGIIQVSIEEG